MITVTCDRCGAPAGPHLDSCRVIIPEQWEFEALLSEFNRAGRIDRLYVYCKDLCPECLRALQEWIGTSKR